MSLHQRQLPTSNYKIKERSLWTRLEEDYYLLFIISSGLTLCRIVSGIISLSFTLVLSSELSNECIKGMLTNGLTAFDSVLPFTYTQFGVISLVFLLIPINHLVLYFWLKKNSRVYRYIVGLSRRFERDED
ncbi:predicted protein [Naegleria gruberi]|uniref:Predicted protein n=1 Tax=Naegleria gruberi TaxID=5762 RepID=D2V3U5_NAEGR|nr:uncharacterized protein NAEGRDRAFT_63492 [Naegleria gruberi]EFC48417.1 predicted protein [Naegleria gruberi]|eukprot:XP_002681161.1 predicted protein [Naegleria gruberi strain NEG-M]